jgi:hypothetical protein
MPQHLGDWKGLSNDVSRDISAKLLRLTSSRKVMSHYGDESASKEKTVYYVDESKTACAGQTDGQATGSRG